MNAATQKPATAALEHLTGPARGTATWLNGTALDISLDDDRWIRVSESEGVQPDESVIARLHGSEDSYEIQAFEAARQRDQ